MRRWILLTQIAALSLSALASTTAVAQGLASKYPGDKGLGSDPAVLYFLDFDDKAATTAWTKGKKGYGWTGKSADVFAGAGALKIQQTQGTHDPFEIHPKITESDEVYVRWYRKWEVGYDFTQHKMPGVYAKAAGASGAGQKPNGKDKGPFKNNSAFRRPIHPGGRCCSSVAYTRYAPSSRLARRAPRPPHLLDLFLNGP